jgi:hypothetical protein
MFVSRAWLICLFAYTFAKHTNDDRRWPQEDTKSGSLIQFPALDDTVKFSTGNLDHFILRRDEYSCDANSKFPSKP